MVANDNHGNGIASAVAVAERSTQRKFIMHTNRRTREPELVCIRHSPATPDSINATLIGAVVIAVHLVISFYPRCTPDHFSEIVSFTRVYVRIISVSAIVEK